MEFGVFWTILIGLNAVCVAQSPTPEAVPGAEAIIRKSLERNAFNEARRKDYTYTESQRTQTFDKSGTVVKTEQETFDVVNLYGRPYKRRVEKDGRALEGKEKQKADEEFEREVRKRAEETPAQRERREAEHEKERSEGRRFLQEIPKAYSFRIAGEETLDTMPVWVIEAQPRPEFRSSVKRADLLKRVRGRLWIDKDSLQWVRAEVEVIEPIAFGGFLARLDRGARMTFLQKRVNDEVWLPSKVTARLEARLLVKRYRLASETTWSGYRKFRVDSRVLADESGTASRQ